MNNEHIIPLALGGHNSFTIPVHAVKNAEIGYQLDAKISANPIVSSARRYYHLRGRSRQKPLVRWPAIHKDLKGTLELTGSDVKFMTYRSKNTYGLNLSLTPASEDQCKSEFTFDQNLILSFGAKLALGASAFLFGSTFKNHGYHEELRTLMNSECSIDKLKSLVSANGGRGFWAISWPQSLSVGEILPTWCDAILGQKDKNIVFTLHTTSEVILGCSILAGFYRWYFNIGKDPEQFPIGGAFEIGAVIDIDLKEKTFQRSNLREYLGKWITI